MTMEPSGSVTHWIHALKGGDDAAANPLWDRYFEKLVRLARRRLVGAGRLGADEDEEDAALSAFDSFCAGAARGRFPLLNGREDLWKLLVVITARKAAAQAQRRRAQKRGGDRARIATGSPSVPGEAPDGLDLEAVVGNEPTPEFTAMVVEQYNLLLDVLGDPSLRQIAQRRMEGYTNDEIADSLGCARRTIARRVELIRTLWTQEAA